MKHSVTPPFSGTLLSIQHNPDSIQPSGKFLLAPGGVVEYCAGLNAPSGFNCGDMTSLLAMIALLPVQSDAQIFFFTMLFCSLALQTMLIQSSPLASKDAIFVDNCY